MTEFAGYARNDMFENRRLQMIRRDDEDGRPPPGIVDLPGSFGMQEMERAAGRIFQKAQMRHVDLRHVTCRVEEMFGQTERTGFLHLLLGGFLRTMFSVTGNSAHGEFLPTDEFVERVLAVYVMKA